MIAIGDYIKAWPGVWASAQGLAPWDITARAPALIAAALGRLDECYEITDGIGIHRTAKVESGVVLKGPIIVGPNCFLAAHSYLRGGVYLGEGCVVSPGCEVKSSFVFERTRLAHFNFLGDSIVGSDVNIEAGAIVANYRNELIDKKLQIQLDKVVFSADVEKFGALIGDHVKIGANAVVAPGALLRTGAIVQRMGLIDQRPVG